jgi:hypothetical protein
MVRNVPAFHPCLVTSTRDEAQAWQSNYPYFNALPNPTGHKDNKPGGQGAQSSNKPVKTWFVAFSSMCKDVLFLF